MLQTSLVIRHMTLKEGETAKEDESTLLDYSLRICQRGVVATNLGCLVRREAFSDPSLKVEDFW
jgi:hypothetical protein